MIREIVEDCRYIIGNGKSKAGMRQTEIDEYLDVMGERCFVCEETVSRDNMTMISSLVELDWYPDHSDGKVLHSYMVCPRCLEDKVLI